MDQRAETTPLITVVYEQFLLSDTLIFVSNTRCVVGSWYVPNAAYW